MRPAIDGLRALAVTAAVTLLAVAAFCCLVIASAATPAGSASQHSGELS